VNFGEIEFDPEKSEINREKHELGFEEFVGFDDEPIVLADTRFAYPEQRFRAFGHIGGMGYMVAFTIRDGRVRLISFRRAREKEIRRHDRQGHS